MLDFAECTPYMRFLWGVVAEQSMALDSSSVICRVWVQILAWSVETLVSLSKAPYHNCFSPSRSANGYQQELGSNPDELAILSKGNRDILSCSMPMKLDLNTGQVRHVVSGQTLLTNVFFVCLFLFRVNSFSSTAASMMEWMTRKRLCSKAWIKRWAKRYVPLLLFRLFTSD